MVFFSSYMVFYNYKNNQYLSYKLNIIKKKEKKKEKKKKFFFNIILE